MNSPSSDRVDHDLRVMIDRRVGGRRIAGGVAGFLVVTAAIFVPAAQRVDLIVRDFADAHRPAAIEPAIQWLSRLGSGGILASVSLALALVLAWRRRSAWPIVPVAAALMLTVAVIQPIKLGTDRAPPHSPYPDDVEVRLFAVTDGISYPSGHAANTIVWYGVLCLLLAAWLRPAVRGWVRILPVVLVSVTTMYLGHHWFSDVLAGLCLGLVVDRILGLVRWPGLPQDPGDHEMRALPVRRS